MNARAPSGVVRIVIDGLAVDVESGLSLAAALLDLDVLAFRQSVRGTPRAPLCGMGICHECRVTIDGVPHRRACMVTVDDGQTIETRSES